eukprot:1950435-Pleurochrysis_carterae.AAC.1
MRAWSTPRVVLLIEFILCLTLSAFFGTGIYYAGETLSWYVSVALTTQFYGVALSTTILVGIYYRTLRLQTKKEFFGRTLDKMVASRLALPVLALSHKNEKELHICAAA